MKDIIIAKMTAEARKAEIKKAREVANFPKEHWIAWAKSLTAEYAKTHKGRNALERECIEKGYIIIEPKKLDMSVTDNRKMVFALSKNTYGTGKNWVPVCEA